MPMCSLDGFSYTLGPCSQLKEPERVGAEHKVHLTFYLWRRVSSYTAQHSSFSHESTL